MARTSKRRKLPAPDTPVAKLYSLGPASSAWLAEIGVFTYADLKRLGAVAAYRLVRQRRQRVSRNLLYALESALRNQSWSEFLTPQVRAKLTALAEAD